MERLTFSIRVIFKLLPLLKLKLPKQKTGWSILLTEYDCPQTPEYLKSLHPDIARVRIVYLWTATTINTYH